MLLVGGGDCVGVSKAVLKASRAAVGDGLEVELRRT
jgi:hypothetical protein